MTLDSTNKVTTSGVIASESISFEDVVDSNRTWVDLNHEIVGKKVMVMVQIQREVLPKSLEFRKDHGTKAFKIFYPVRQNTVICIDKYWENDFEL